MGVLSNPKHERFAQELCKGASQVEAYERAGYKPNDGHAARLAGNGRIKDRVAELQEKASHRTEISVAKLTEDLLRLAKNGELFNTESGTQAARACLMDAAKLNGLIVDLSKAETQNINYAISSEPVENPDQWLDQHKPN